MFDSSELVEPALTSWSPAEIAAINDDPLLLFIPTLEVFLHLISSRVATSRDSLLRCRFRLGGIQSENLAKQMHDSWIILSEIAFEWRDTCERFRQYDTVHNQGRAQKNPKCTRLLKQNEKAINEAARSADFAQEMLAVYGNRFSLEDSKASIKQAELAREDSQRSRLSKYNFIAIEEV